MSVFEKLNGINVNGHTEKKNGLTYLSWAWAWAEVKKAFPDAQYSIYENEDGWNYHTDGRTCWVKTGVTIEGLEHIEYLPVMDHRNKSISADAVTSFDVNKAIQRSLTKACARHGLGLYIYAGEDLPEDETAAKPAPKPVPTQAEKPQVIKCDECGKQIDREQAEYTFRRYSKRKLCKECQRKATPDKYKCSACGEIVDFDMATETNRIYKKVLCGACAQKAFLNKQDIKKVEIPADAEEIE